MECKAIDCFTKRLSLAPSLVPRIYLLLFFSHSSKRPLNPKVNQEFYHRHCSNNFWNAFLFMLNTTMQQQSFLVFWQALTKRAKAFNSCVLCIFQITHPSIPLCH